MPLVPIIIPPTETSSPDPEPEISDKAYDAALVQRFLSGDESAFAEIHSRYYRKMLTIALSLLRNRADAEEIAQDTFIRAYKGLVRFRGDSSLATWLHRIAVNLSSNRYWYFSRRGRGVTLSIDHPLNDDSDATLADLVPAEEMSPSRSAMNDEFDSIVTACMENLAPSHREILTLRNVLHRSYDEIASLLQINVGTVKSRIARARDNLRSLIAKTYPGFDADADGRDCFGPHRDGGKLRKA